MTAIPARFRRRRDAERTKADPLLIVSSVVLAVLLLASAAASITGFAGSTAQTVGLRLQPPSAEFPLGTDALGRSLLPRLLEGIGTTLLLSVIAVTASATVSIVLGIVSGYAGGATSEAVSRLVDVIYAFPALVLAILISAVVGPGSIAAVASIVLITIPLMTRMVRIEARRVANRDFVIAARIAGIGAPRIIATHILPNVAGAIAIQASYALSVAILIEGGLSFLGYGVQVPEASLGVLIQDGMLYLTTAPWLLFAPATVLVVSVLSVNLIGDGLRDRLEPRQTRRLS